MTFDGCGHFGRLPYVARGCQKLTDERWGSLALPHATHLQPDLDTAGPYTGKYDSTTNDGNALMELYTKDLPPIDILPEVSDSRVK
jgi:hypothetical protein